MKNPAFLTLFALLACGDKADTGSDDFAPTEGSWSYDGLVYESDECNLEASFSAATLEAIVWTMTLTEGGLELVTATADPVSCTLSGVDLTCDVTLVTDHTEWPEGSANTGDPDATTTSAGLVEGTFSDAETSTLTFTVTNTCDGADCDAYLTERESISPCTTVLTTGFVYTGE